jgi:hypothetical protein
MGTNHAAGVARNEEQQGLALWVSRRLVPAACLMAFLALGTTMSSQGIAPRPAALHSVPPRSPTTSRALPLPSPIPSPSLPLPSPIPSPSLPLPSPIPSPPLPHPSPIPLPSPPLLSPAPSPSHQSPVPSSRPSPPALDTTGVRKADPAVRKSSQPPLSPRTASRGNGPAAGSRALSKSSGHGSARSPQMRRTGSPTVCPILGVGGDGCPGLPQRILQQLAETGYGRILALIVGVILVLAGIGGLIRSRRRPQMLS